MVHSSIELQLLHLIFTSNSSGLVKRFKQSNNELPSGVGPKSNGISQNISTVDDTPLQIEKIKNQNIVCSKSRQNDQTTIKSFFFF